MFASMSVLPARAQRKIPLRCAAHIAVVVLVAFVTGCEQRVASGVPRGSGRIVVLGDSLAVSPTRAENFPVVLEARLAAAGLTWRVFNAGVRGDTTAGGLRRIDSLIASYRPDILILALGANDGLRRIDVAEISRNLTEIIIRAKREKSLVLLCGMQLPPLNMLPYGRRYREAFAEVAAQTDVSFVPFLLEDVAMSGSMNGADGIHPNAEGAARIADTIWPYLDELIRRPD